MRYGIPLLANRVAHQSTHADGVLIILMHKGHVLQAEFVGCPIHNQFELLSLLRAYEIETLVCGENSLEIEVPLRALDINVIGSVNCSVDQALAGLKDGTLRTGRPSATA